MGVFSCPTPETPAPELEPSRPTWGLRSCCHRGGSELPPRSGCGSARMPSWGQVPFPLPAAPGPQPPPARLCCGAVTQRWCGPLSLGVQGGECELRWSGSRQRSGRLLRCFLNDTNEGRRPPGSTRVHPSPPRAHPGSTWVHPGPPQLHPVYTEAHPGHLCRPPWSALSSRGGPRSRAMEVTRDEQSWAVHVTQVGS